MISRTLFTDILIMMFLVALQFFVLNRIVIFGKYTPVLYPVFVMFYPFFRNKFQFLALSFLIGLIMDTFLNTGGINAFATTFIAYFRTLIFRTSTDSSTDFFSFQSLQWSQFLLFLLSSIFLHQLFVQYIEFFKFSRIFEILLNVLVTTGISFIFIIIYALIFKIKQKV
ncbi:rod shape-determining protein MreD [Chryseobacterium sp.]|uniref:rod shape-determining protein MreD n=1 Tax=Chryseobacterium sp. TaxID=1871047 RepID=UPI0028A0200A|nr:rod shape-determining protein MreD [Chryseobacterium sp.]